MRENACYPPGDINIPNTLDFYFQVIIPQLYSAANLATQVTTYEIPLKTFVKFVGFCFSDFDGRLADIISSPPPFPHSMLDFPVFGGCLIKERER